MEDTRKRRLPIILFIIVMAVFFSGFIYAVMFSSKGQSSWSRYQQHVAESKSSSPAKKLPNPDIPIILPRDEVVTVGKIKLIYRGRVHRKLNIAVVIPALDPKTAYLHSIDFKQAKKGLRLGGELFSVVSINSDRLTLLRGPQGSKLGP